MSNTNDKEIEIQVQIENYKDLFNFLKKEAKFISEEHQTDKYFSPSHRDFLRTKPVDEWLRLRDSSGKLTINYKNWHHDKNGRSNFCDEYETFVGNISDVEKIFKVLAINHVVTVDKVRKIYKYKSYEISIDSIKGLGDFVEIEYKGESADVDPVKITKEMIQFLKDLNCGKILRNHVGYPFQLLFPKEIKFEEV